MGITQFNELAGACFRHESPCSSGRLAIVLNGVVISAPTIQAESFKRDQIQISGNFTEKEAKDLYDAVSDATHGVLPWIKTQC